MLNAGTTGSQTTSSAIGVVGHAFELTGSNRIEGSIQILRPEAMNLSGNAVVTGDLLVPGTPTVRFSGNPGYGGTLLGSGNPEPSNYVIGGIGSFSLRHVILRSNPRALVPVPAPPQPAGTRDVTLSTAEQTAGNFATIRNLTVGGKAGNVLVPPGTYGAVAVSGRNSLTLGIPGAQRPAIYNFQRLTFAGDDDLRIVGPVVITVNSGVTLGGRVGSAANPGWLKLRLATGDLVLSGNNTIYGEVSVPAGTVHFNGNSELIGALQCDRLVLLGNNLLRLIVLNTPPEVADRSLSATEDTAAPISLAGVDADGDALSFTIVSLPEHGTLSGPASNLTYTPAEDYHGPDSFTYKANDGQTDSNVAVVNITVAPVNDVPVADSQTVTTEEDVPREIVFAADDVESDALQFRVVAHPQHGTLSGTPPNVTYTPHRDYFGNDQITFVAGDGEVESAAATVSIAVGPINDPPEGIGQAIRTLEDQEAAVVLSGRDAEASPLTYRIVAAPQHGHLEGTLPALTYRPDPNYNGPDSFTFRANDGKDDSAMATVAITVDPENDVPKADEQNHVTREDEDLPLLLTGSDIDPDPLAFTVVLPPSHGTLSGTPPNIIYTPAADSNGPDSFTFKTSDREADSAIATVTITVTPQPDAPVASAQEITTLEDTELPIILGATDADGDVLTFNVGTPQNGVLYGTAPRFTYTPTSDFHGVDSFSFSVTDQSGMEAAATVTITVKPVNDRPTAAPGTAITDEDVPVELRFSGSDIDGEALTFAIVASPEQGTLSGTPPQMTYRPAPNFSGTDRVLYRASDGQADSVSAEVRITVRPVNDAPVVELTSPGANAEFEAGEVIRVSARATDVDGTIPRVSALLDGTVVSDAQEGSLAFDLTSVVAGNHILTAVAVDSAGATTTSAAVPFSVRAPSNGAVQVNAGPDRLIAMPAAARLEGAVIVNGAAAGSDVRLSWQKVSGPGNAVLDAAAALNPNVTFDAPGEYVLRLSASLPIGSGSDTVRVTVLPQPESGPDSPISNRGREFWMTFTGASYPSGSRTGSSLIISSEVAASGTVEISRVQRWEGVWEPSRETKPFTVQPGKDTVVSVSPGFPETYYEQWDQVLPTAIRVVADAPVAVVAANSAGASTDGALILPNSLLGRDYRVMSYRNYTETRGTVQVTIGGTQLAVVATQDNTEVTITPTVTTGSHPAFEPFMVSLQKGEVYRAINNDDPLGDFTGTRVQANRPIAVFAGHTCANVPSDVKFCDYLYEQMPPISTWGQRYVTMPLKARTGGDRFRVLAAEDATRVSVNGAVVATLNRGEFHEMLMRETAFIVADRPVLLAQYAQGIEFDKTTGDPFLMLVPPFEMYGRRHILSTLRVHDRATNKEVDIYSSYVGVVVDSRFTNDVRISGNLIPATAFSPIASSGFSGASVQVPRNSTSDITSSAPIGAWIYGWAPYDSYGFTGGIYGAFDDARSGLELTQVASNAALGSAHRVLATLHDDAGFPVQDARVHFGVTGVNAVSGWAVTAADGTAEFAWVGAAAGEDLVRATVGDRTATLSVTWAFEPANQAPQVNAGSDQTLRFGETLSLLGLVQDDGAPSGGRLRASWVSLGLAGVTFADANSAATTATFSAPGIYRLRLTGHDGQFAATDEMTVIVNDPPRFREVVPSAEAVLVGNSWGVGVGAEDIDGLVARIELIDNGQVLAAVQPDRSVVWRYSAMLSTTFATVGKHTLTIRLTDDRGMTAERTLDVNVGLPLSVELLTPANESVFAAGQPVTLTARASSPNGAVTRLVYHIYSSYNWTEHDREGSAESDYRVEWTPPNSGYFDVVAIAYDSTGQTAVSSRSYFQVELPPAPTVIITSPEPDISVYPNQRVVLRATAAVSAPAQFGSIGFAVGDTYVGDCTSLPCEVEWTPGTVGRKTITATVYDTFGGIGQTTTTVDVVHYPQLRVSFVKPAGAYVQVNRPVEFVVAVEEMYGSLIDVDFYLNGEYLGRDANGRITWTPTEHGFYVLYARASSFNPYQNGEATIAFNAVDIHPPAVQLSAPLDRASFAPGTPIVIQAQASDVDGNLSYLQFQDDSEVLAQIGLEGGAGVAEFVWENAAPGWHDLGAVVIDLTGESSSASVRVFVQRLVSNAILPPADLIAKAASARSVQLSWTPSVSPGAVGTAIERRAASEGAWEEIATVEGSADSYEDRDLQPETYYSYRVAALDAAGMRSNYSPEASATTEVQLSQYAVLDLGESLERSFVALNLIEQRFLTAQTNGGTAPPAALLDLRDSEIMSIDEESNVLLKKRATTSDGRTAVEYYLLWHPDRPADTIGDPNFRAYRLSRGGVVAGAVNRSTSTVPVADAIYQGLEFWLQTGSYPGMLDRTRIDVRAAIWTPTRGVQELTPNDQHQYRYDWHDVRPARTLLGEYDSLYSTWDVSNDGTAVGTGTWVDMTRFLPDTDLESVFDYRPMTYQHGMRWKAGQWDTLGSLWKQAVEGEGESTATAINPLGTIVVGGSSAPRRPGDADYPTHGMRSQMLFGFRPLEPGDPSLEDLAPLGAGSYSWALDVSAGGDAVGYSTKHPTDPISRTQAAYWAFGTGAAEELPNLGGLLPSYPEGFGYANAINAAGDRIVGKSLTTEGYTAGVLWALNANHGGTEPKWEVHDLNRRVPGDWFVLNAVDINKSGLIVGTALHTLADPANPGALTQVRRAVLLLPVNITVTKKGGHVRPNGLLVRTGDTLEFKLTDLPPDDFPIPAENIEWYQRQLTWNGDHTPWDKIGSHARGVKFDHTAGVPGVFQVQAQIRLREQVMEIEFDRDERDPHTRGMHELKEGDRDAIGVAENDRQIATRNHAMKNLGNPAYGFKPPFPPAYPELSNKCNLFVAHKATDAGAYVPWINIGILDGGTRFPPTANQWGGTQTTYDPSFNNYPWSQAIDGWMLLPATAWPVPGNIVARPIDPPLESGHTGIVDYDGRWISAAADGVTRNANFKSYQPSRQRKYTGD